MLKEIVDVVLGITVVAALAVILAATFFAIRYGWLAVPQLLGLPT